LNNYTQLNIILVTENDNSATPNKHPHRQKSFGNNQGWKTGSKKTKFIRKAENLKTPKSKF